MNELDEDRVFRWVRASIPPVVNADPSRDLWPDLVGRLRDGPRVSPPDILLLAAVLACAPFFPGAFVFLVCAI